MANLEAFSIVSDHLERALCPQWDLHDLSRASAALSLVHHDFLRGVAHELWQRVERLVRAQGHHAVYYVRRTGCCPNNVRPSVPSLRRVLHAAGMSRTGTQAMLLERIRQADAAGRRVGVHCPVSLGVAASVVRMGEALINSSVAERLYRIDRDAFADAWPDAVSLAPGARGLRFRYSAVRRFMPCDLNDHRPLERHMRLVNGEIREAQAQRERRRRLEDALREASVVTFAEGDLRGDAFVTRGEGSLEAAVQRVTVAVERRARRETLEGLLRTQYRLVRDTWRLYNDPWVLGRAGATYEEAVGRLEAEQARMAGQAGRREALVAALEARGLRLRPDSRCCHAWIHTGVGGMEDVVETMAEMDWFYKRTIYPRVLRRKPYDGFDSGFDSDDSDDSEDAYDPHLESEIAKERALRRFRGGVPADAPRNVLRLCEAYGIAVCARATPTVPSW